MCYLYGLQTTKDYERFLLLEEHPLTENIVLTLGSSFSQVDIIIDANWTIYDLKVQYYMDTYNEKSVLPRHLKLVYQGRVLDDNLRIKNLGLENYDALAVLKDFNSL
jgi:hypothetical protein